MKPTASPAVTRSKSTPPSSHSRTGLRPPACPSARSSPLEFGHFQSAPPHGWGMLQLAIRAQLGRLPLLSPPPPPPGKRTNPTPSSQVVFRFLRASAPPRQKYCLLGPGCAESGTASPASFC